MQNISVFGISAVVKASTTFPNGFTVTEFPDDTDPFDVPEVSIADSAMSINGELLVWSKPVPIEITVSVIPNSAADKNFEAIFNANLPTRNQKGARDEITISVVYPDGKIRNLAAGFMHTGSPMLGGSSAGRMKTRSYKFTFEKAS